MAKTAVEIKAEVFDLLKEMESYQVKLNELNEKKNKLLKELAEIKE